jgi:hypothetical protein
MRVGMGQVTQIQQDIRAMQASQNMFFACLVHEQFNFFLKQMTQILHRSVHIFLPLSDEK